MRTRDWTDGGTRNGATMSLPLMIRRVDAAKRRDSRSTLIGAALVMALAIVIVCLLMASTPAIGQQRLHGIGYSDSLQPGARACLYPTWPAYFSKAGCISSVMDLSAQPFGPGQPQDGTAMARRFGGHAPGSVTPDGQGSWLVSCDAESIQQSCAKWLEEQCRQSAAAATYDCSLDWNGPEGWRGARDSYDYWATHPAGLGGGGGGPVSRTPGQPAIVALSSPGARFVAVSWRTRLDHSAFAVSAGPALRRVPGNVFSTIVELPAGAGGDVPVSVTAFYGETAGLPSLMRTVHVERSADPVPTPTPGPTPQPTATPTPTPPAGECAQKVAVWPEWLAFLAKVARCKP